MVNGQGAGAGRGAGAGAGAGAGGAGAGAPVGAGAVAGAGAAAGAAAAPPILAPADLAALSHAIGVAVAGALPAAPPTGPIERLAGSAVLFPFLTCTMSITCLLHVYYMSITCLKCALSAPEGTLCSVLQAFESVPTAQFRHNLNIFCNISCLLGSYK